MIKVLTPNQNPPSFKKKKKKAADNITVAHTLIINRMLWSVVNIVIAIFIFIVMNFCVNGP